GARPRPPRARPRPRRGPLRRRDRGGRRAGRRHGPARGRAGRRGGRLPRPRARRASGGDPVNERAGFYRRILDALLADGTLSRDMSVLVVAGGQADRDAFLSAGFEHVTISNVDESGDVYAPYAWSRQ